MFAVLTWQSFAGELFEGEALPLSIVSPTVSDAALDRLSESKTTAETVPLCCTSSR